MIFNVTKNLKKYLWTNQKSYTNWITKIDQKYRLDKIFQIKLRFNLQTNLGSGAEVRGQPTRHVNRR